MVATAITVNLRRIVILFLVVLGLGAYLYFYEIPQAEKEAAKSKLVAVDKDAITGIDLVYPDREIDLTKSDKGWQLTKPVSAPAEESSVTSLLGPLTDTKIEKTLEGAPSDPAAYGLDKPNPLIRLTLKDGAQQPPLAIGKNTTVGGAKTYVRLGDEPKVYLTNNIQPALNKQAKDLRDKQLLSFQDDDVQRVEIALDGGEKTTLLRKDKDAWTVEPGDYPADTTEVRSYLSGLRTARAVDFADDTPVDLGKYGLSKPKLTVTITTGKDTPVSQSLLIGSEKSDGTKQTYVKRGDQAAITTLSEWSVKSLGKKVADLRDKTVLGFDPARVGQVLIERKDGNNTTLARDGETGWRIESTEQKKPRIETITRFLDDLRDLRGSEIAAEPAKDLRTFGLDAPDVRITLTDRDGQPMGTIAGAAQTSGEKKYYAMRVGGTTIFTARDYIYARIDKQQSDFVDTGEAPKPPTAPAPTPAPPLGGGADADDDAGDED